jgi:hypothetical protein
MDIEEIVEASRWIMKSNWGPTKTPPRLWPRASSSASGRGPHRKGQPVHITMLNANA